MPFYSKKMHHPHSATFPHVRGHGHGHGHGQRGGQHHRHGHFHDDHHYMLKNKKKMMLPLLLMILHGSAATASAAPIDGEINAGTSRELVHKEKFVRDGPECPPCPPCYSHPPPPPPHPHPSHPPHWGGHHPPPPPHHPEHPPHHNETHHHNEWDGHHFAEHEHEWRSIDISHLLQNFDNASFVKTLLETRGLLNINLKKFGSSSSSDNEFPTIVKFFPKKTVDDSAIDSYTPLFSINEQIHDMEFVNYDHSLTATLAAPKNAPFVINMVGNISKNKEFGNLYQFNITKIYYNSQDISIDDLQKAENIETSKEFDDFSDSFISNGFMAPPPPPPPPHHGRFGGHHGEFHPHHHDFDHSSDEDIENDSEEEEDDKYDKHAKHGKVKHGRKGIHGKNKHGDDKEEVQEKHAKHHAFKEHHGFEKDNHNKHTDGKDLDLKEKHHDSEMKGGKHHDSEVKGDKHHDSEMKGGKARGDKGDRKLKSKDKNHKEEPNHSELNTIHRNDQGSEHFFEEQDSTFSDSEEYVNVPDAKDSDDQETSHHTSDHRVKQMMEDLVDSIKAQL